MQGNVAFIMKRFPSSGHLVSVPELVTERWWLSWSLSDGG